MNAAILAAEIVSGAGLVFGQFWDVYNTYIGIYVQKTATENGTGLAKFLAKNKYSLLLVKPAVAIAAAIGLNYAANTVHTGQAIDAVVSHAFVIGPSIVGAVLGYLAGAGNRKLNQEALAAQNAKLVAARLESLKK